jgi:hypothetical protein
MGIGLATRPTPTPHDLIGQDHTALGHQLCAVAVAEADADIELHTMAKHLPRKPRALIRLGCGRWVHATSLE